MKYFNFRWRITCHHGKRLRNRNDTSAHLGNNNNKCLYFSCLKHKTLNSINRIVKDDYFNCMVWPNLFELIRWWQWSSFEALEIRLIPQTMSIKLGELSYLLVCFHVTMSYHGMVSNFNDALVTCLHLNRPFESRECGWSAMECGHQKYFLLCTLYIFL